MECRITVLCENTVPRPNLIGEHGFSAYIETPGHHFLFDTGQGFALVPNSIQLKKDLRKVDRLVLSHGHFDHTGGLLAFLGAHGPCDITAHPDVLSDRYWTVPTDNGPHTLSVGMPWTESCLTTRGARFQWTTEFSELAPNVFITGEVPRHTGFEPGDPNFATRRNNEWGPDLFLDDYSLVVKTSKGLVVVLGCAHAGLINILDHAVEKTGEERIHAVLGGTHLGYSPETQLAETIRRLMHYKIERLAVSHCTGQGPVARIAAAIPDGFAFGHVGFVLEV